MSDYLHYTDKRKKKRMHEAPADINGDTVGIEIYGALSMQHSTDLKIQPIFFKLNAAGNATFGPADGVTSGSNMTYTGPPQHWENDAGEAEMGHHYLTQIIVRGTPDVQGTYAHGFAVDNTSGGPSVLSWLSMSAGVRQLNDQDDVSYRDTRR